MVALLAAAALQATAFSVAGVRIGDSPEQAKAALAKAGYRIGKIEESDSYSQRLRDARSAQLREPTTKPRATAVGAIIAAREDQRITVSFDDDATGKRVVAAVRYLGANIAHPYNVVRDKLKERYGPPTKMRPQSAAWCVGGGENCDAGGIMDQESIAVRAESELNGRNVTTIALQVGEETRKAWNRAHLAALKKIVQAPDAF